MDQIVPPGADVAMNMASLATLMAVRPNEESPAIQAGAALGVFEAGIGWTAQCLAAYRLRRAVIERCPHAPIMAQAI
jgi:hypothetical protein